MSPGARSMTEAISDTGPILHLHEVDQLSACSVFDHLLMPDLVVDELQTYGLDSVQLDAAGVRVTPVPVAPADWTAILNESGLPPLHPADGQVYVVARWHAYHLPILTDDLALRRRLEQNQALVIGTVAVLVRAYTLKRLKRVELELAVDALFSVSTLHMSRAFRTYVRRLIEALP
jgi:hypothetical protein